jgi:hypothetical protein
MKIGNSINWGKVFIRLCFEGTRVSVLQSWTKVISSIFIEFSIAFNFVIKNSKRLFYLSIIETPSICCYQKWSTLNFSKDTIQIEKIWHKPQNFRIWCTCTICSYGAAFFHHWFDHLLKHLLWCFCWFGLLREYSRQVTAFLGFSTIYHSKLLTSFE